MNLIFFIAENRAGLVDAEWRWGHTQYDGRDRPDDEQPEECFNGRRETHKRFFDSALFFTPI